jgi:hypothetical protein
MKNCVPSKRHLRNKWMKKIMCVAFQHCFWKNRYLEDLWQLKRQQKPVELVDPVFEPARKVHGMVRMDNSRCPHSWILKGCSSQDRQLQVGLASSLQPYGQWHTKAYFLGTSVSWVPLFPKTENASFTYFLLTTKILDMNTYKSWLDKS